MRTTLLILLLCMTAASRAQDNERSYPTLNIGDPAPPLRIKEWLKGKPIRHFERGQVYVVEFWTTWCAPCRASIPHISELAERYKGRVTFIGINRFTLEIIPMQRVKHFIDSMGMRMNYNVAAEDSNYMSNDWIVAADEPGLPGAIVIDRDGTVAWIGHPMFLGKVLPKIVQNRWDVKKALAKRKRDRYLDSLDMEAYYRLAAFWPDHQKTGDRGRPDLALLAIRSMVIKEPLLKYAPHIAYQTFVSLLKTDPQKACEYGKAAIATPTYQEPAFDAIIGAIETYGDSLDLSPDIYQLGANACQAFIDWYPYHETIDIFRDYSKMAAWYAKANKKSKAIKAMQKAIDALKSKKDFSPDDLATLTSRLREYKNM